MHKLATMDKLQRFKARRNRHFKREDMGYWIERQKNNKQN